MWRISIVRADHPSIERELEAGQYTVGRLPDCDITLNDPQVSRRHCELLATTEALKIRDLGSGNGVHVNGKRVVEAAIAADDDIKIGSWKLSVL